MQNVAELTAFIFQWACVKLKGTKATDFLNQ